MLISLLLSSLLTLVELNCENLFDCRHDALKNDMEFTPEGARHWTPDKYWNKLNRIGREILSSSAELPDIVALCEVENDSVLHDLTRRSLLREAHYDYLMTESPDGRGIDVALLYQPMRFRPVCYDYVEVAPIKDMRPTRDILHVEGIIASGDTLHVFVLHAPSRYSGEKASRPFRAQVSKTLLQHIAGIEGNGRKNIIVAGDFNDYASNVSLTMLEKAGLINITKAAGGLNNFAGGTYRFNGEWRSIDHVLLSPALVPKVKDTYINDSPFLLEEDDRYGGHRPRRSFSGYRYHRDGFSDHLPLVVRFDFEKGK